MKHTLIFKVFIFTFFMLSLSLFVASLSAAYTCGNGKKEQGEVCDWGSNNSDTAPNSCRTDCRMAYCGDGVIDNGEECDDGQYTVDHPQSTQCRSYCKLPRCGDGVVDNGTRTNPNRTYNEMCDDGNTSNEDGCMNSCKPCVVLSAAGNIEITDDTDICAGTVTLDDYGDYGTIIIKKSGITLDCNHAKLKGEGRGVGIMVFRSHNVTIKNCEVYGYEVGIKGEDSNNVTLSGNRLCGNSIADIEFDEGTTQMVGRNNACGQPGSWNDTGKQGCSKGIPVCNPPTVNGGAMVTQGLGARSVMLKNMPQVKIQTNTTPVKPLSESMKANVKLVPVTAAPTDKKIKLPPKTQRVPVLPKK